MKKIKMKKVFLTRKIPELAFKILKETKNIQILSLNNTTKISNEDFLKVIKQNKDIEGLLIMLTDKIDISILKLLPKLKVISTMSVGFDHIKDINKFKLNNIQIGNTPDVLTDTTTDLCVTLLLSTARRIKESINSVQNGAWPEWEPNCNFKKLIFNSF